MPPFIKYYALAWRRACDYKGRSTRSEHWWAALDAVLFAIILTLIALASEKSPGPDSIQAMIAIFQVPHLVILLPLQIRLLRDAGKRRIFASFLPCIGVFADSTYLLCQP
jgi:uncharacterized membrane protein YhaH (DUF805 family)